MSEIGYRKHKNKVLERIRNAVKFAPAYQTADPEELFSQKEAVDLYTDRVKTDEFFEPEKKAVDRYFTKSGGTVLDIGCGVGRVSHLLSDRGFEVTGIDVSEPFVDRAQSLFPDLEFHVMDVTDTEFPSETFDYAVFSYYGLDYVLPKSNREQALREIFRLLKPGGIIVFSSHNWWNLIPDILVGGGTRFADLFLTPKNVSRALSRYRLESVPIGELEIYLSSPVHQRLQLRRCGFTPLTTLGKRDGGLKLLEMHLHYVAKK